ncbi:Phosphoserine aminotransferase [Venustampulla echinocandica]|uniref:phosphoserine transaminase n=1 Tax=Venustampulla echinocandica TaxID=2656787 RepID=A0A370TRH1_9HELO|nr:Phosphoserine aminotransferase [Venustampulla echinocandica]RDL38120.1 Phosphoserine aminotransferase [Venustampulla echinocandica]
MPSRSDITYFGAGPALLPTDILEDAAKALLNYHDTGLGIAEHSHRSQLAADVINQAKADLVSCLDIPDDYEILFMQGGGTGQFSATAYNFVGAWVTRKQQEIFGEIKGDPNDSKVIQRLKEAVDKDLKIDYLITGGWSQKASAEGERLFGSEHVNIAADSRKTNGGKFGTIPDESTWKLSKDAALVYFCSNETVDGVEFPGFPKSLQPGPDGKGPIVVADMSSNILTKKIPVKNFSAIFFGAQKNLGPTGITVVIIKKSFLPPFTSQPSANLMRQLGLPIPPIIFQYETIAKNNSLYNTLSIFDVYIIGQVLRKLLQTYPDKVEGQQAVSNKKAQLVYDAIEAFPEIYQIIPNKAVRSRINICFRVIKGGDMDTAERAFLEEGIAQGLTGLKGHRSLGGIRASNYNSVPLEGAEKLAKFIRAFAMS